MADDQAPRWDAEELAPIRLALQNRFHCSPEEVIRRLQGLWEEDPPRPSRSPSPHRIDEPPSRHSPERQRSPEPQRRSPSPPPTHPPDSENVVIMDFDDDAQPPDFLPKQVSRYAIEKINNFDLVYLWYFTAAGILDAASSFSSIAEGSLNLHQTKDGYLLHYDKEAKPSKNEVIDENLEWYQITEAKHNLLEVVANWPEKNRMALTLFFIRLEGLKAAGFSDKALVLYQARLRALWHAGLKGKAKPFNISNINMTTLASIENEVRDKKQEDLEEKVEVLSRKCELGTTGSHSVLSKV